MAEPDFDQIARELAPAIGPEEPFPYRKTVAAIAAQLRQVWNARGAADQEAIHAELSARMGEIGYSVSTYDTAIADALRKVDR